MQRSASDRLLRGCLLVSVAVVTCLGLVVEVGAWSTPDAAWVDLCAIVAGSIAAKCPAGGP